jgi:hypothetical protein
MFVPAASDRAGLCAQVSYVRPGQRCLGVWSMSPAGWLDARSRAGKDQAVYVAIDPCPVYRSAITKALPHAVIVVDHFHLVRLAK